jgi:RNA polymerase sigma factor (sigma-70 family)
MSDQQLLREYLGGGSERAFQSLVQRHVDLVYSTALRRLCDTGLAEEVTQNVFVALARKAPFLNRDIGLAGWLYKTTLLEARHRQRAELRRRRREETAVVLGTTMKEEDSLLKSLSPVLDEGLMELRERDRHAVLLRFFENKNLREVGEALGIGEDAAQKRVAKALGELTRWFHRRGYPVPAAVFSAALHGATQAAPAGLASAAAQTGLQSAGALSLTGLGLLAAKVMGLTKTQTAALCLLVSAGPLAYEWNAVRHAANEAQKRGIELTELHQTLAGYQTEQERLERVLRFINDSIAQLEVEHARRKMLASSIPKDTDPRLYRWSEASEYVRLPKSLFTWIQLYDPSMDSRKPQSGRPKWSPALTKDGKVSLVVLEALGLDEFASTHVQQAFLEFARSYRQLEGAHTTLTNSLPEGFHVYGPYQTSITAAFPEEGKALETRLRNAVEQTMDRDRTAALWNYLRGSFDQFNDFGARNRTLVLHFDKDGSALITHPDTGYMTQVFVLNEVPEVFKPFVEEWKAHQEHQTNNE